MLTKETEIINKLGLHARASAKLTQLAGKYKCEVWMARKSWSKPMVRMKSRQWTPCLP